MSFKAFVLIDDPTAGSPTETLLRLLLPPNAWVRRSFRKPMPPCDGISTSLNSSPSHSVGSSDGRCVQRAGTYSTRDDDSHLQGIPCSREIVPSLCPKREGVSHGYPIFTDQDLKHADSFIVARVRPRTSKGITDLLLLNFVGLETPCPSKKRNEQPNVLSS